MRGLFCQVSRDDRWKRTHQSSEGNRRGNYPTEPSGLQALGRSLTVDLSYEDLVNIHEFVQRTLGINAGVRDSSLVDAIAKRPSQGYFGTTPFRDTQSKAASIMEAIIRWSPFVDGNKRTALLATSAYLQVNGYSLVCPLSAVRFCVQIAQVTEDDPDTTRRLLRRIEGWIRVHSAPKNTLELKRKFNWHLYYPTRLLGFLIRIRLRIVAFALLDYWLAFDLYPESRKDVESTLHFLLDLAKVGVARRTGPSGRPRAT